MTQGQATMKRVWLMCGVALSIFALHSNAQKYVVGFENSAYSVGDNYGKSNQGADWNVQWSDMMDSGQAKISTNAKASGERSLQIRYAPNVQEPKQALWTLTGAKTYYLQYKLLFAENFAFNGQSTDGGRNGGKLPGLAGRPASSSGQICGGGSRCGSGKGFTARLMWRTDGIGEAYIYDFTQTSDNLPYGESLVFTGDRKFKRGAWQTITQRVTVNDPGASNGVIQVWLDGSKVVDVSGRKIVGQNEDVDAVFFSTFFGGNTAEWFPSSGQSSFFDDFIVSTSASDVGL